MNGIRKVLSYSDVWLIPKFSPYDTKAGGDLVYSYRDIPLPFYSIPLINAPMDSLGVNIMVTLANSGLSTTIHRFFENVNKQIEKITEYKQRITTGNCVELFVAVGSMAKHYDWIKTLLEYKREFGYAFGFLVDMAHGNTQAAIDTVVFLRTDSLKSGMKYNIMAGNVATRDGFERLANAGANFIRVGIGGGCFVPETLIQTEHGFQKISDVVPGTKVVTHLGTFEEVTDTISYETQEDLIEINGMRCTVNHEFYVVSTKYISLVTEENISSFAKWVRADELTEEYVLIKAEF